VGAGDDEALPSPRRSWARRGDGGEAWGWRATSTRTAQLPPSPAAAFPSTWCQVGFIDGYQFQHDEEAFAFQRDVPRFRLATPAEIAAAGARMGQRYKSGCYWRSVIADSPTYLMWLMREVVAAGGLLVKRQVTTVAELAPYFDVIVNCTGLGARDLVGDTSMVAIRGQLIRVYAPQVKRFITNSAGEGKRCGEGCARHRSSTQRNVFGIPPPSLGHGTQGPGQNGTARMCCPAPPLAWSPWAAPLSAGERSTAATRQTWP